MTYVYNGTEWVIPTPPEALDPVEVLVHAATRKTTLAANDELALVDSADGYSLKNTRISDLQSRIVAALVASAPTTLDTLNELAAALGNDANFATTVTTLLAAKADLVDTDASNLLTSGESTITRRHVMASSISTGTGNLRLTYSTARKTETISQLRVPSGGTAAGATPTLCRLGIYTGVGSGTLTLAASTANDTTLFAATNTEYLKSLSGGNFSKTKGQRYAVGILVVTSATAPTLVGANALLAAAAGRAPRLGGMVSGQSDLPATISEGSISDNGHQAYVELLP